MRKVLFPFDKVKPDSNIVIYGIGDVGKQYISQLLSPQGAQGIKIALALDANGILTLTHLHYVPVFPPETILHFDADKYDYVVIAVFNEETATGIRNTLHGYGVPDEKIVWSIRFYDDVKTLYSPEVHTWFMPSFSWYGEDLIVKGIFRNLGINHPSYLDVGCNLPYQGNNTALLYLTGSKGTSIDANINCIHLMEQERPDDQNLCVGVATEESEKNFYMLGDYEGLNSFSKDYIDDYINVKHFREEGEVKVNKVRCERLETIIRKYCGGVFPDYFDLDIEGLDDAVIASYDFSQVCPKVICVETHSNKVCDQLLQQGYALYFEPPHNSIYVQAKYMDKLIVTNAVDSGRDAQVEPKTPAIVEPTHELPQQDREQRNETTPLPALKRLRRMARVLIKGY